MTEGPPTMVYWVPLTDLGKFNQQTLHNVQFSRINTQFSRLVQQKQKEKLYQKLLQLDHFVNVLKMTFSCI